MQPSHGPGWRWLQPSFGRLFFVIPLLSIILSCYIRPGRCDVSKLPLKTECLDGVHAGAALHCWSKLEDSLSEVYRVLKPGKGFFATTFLTCVIFDCFFRLGIRVCVFIILFFFAFWFRFWLWLLVLVCFRFGSDSFWVGWVRFRLTIFVGFAVVRVGRISRLTIVGNVSFAGC